MNEAMQDAGGSLVTSLRVLPNNAVDDCINAVRVTLPLCYFDEAECKQGLSFLKSYRKEWDENHGTGGTSRGTIGPRTAPMDSAPLRFDWKEIEPELTKEQIEANRKAEGGR